MVSHSTCTFCPNHTKTTRSQQCCHMYKDPQSKQSNREVNLCPSHMSHCGAKISPQCR